MLFNVNVPKRFWVEAVAMVRYLINRFFLVHLNFRTPKEPWSKKPIKYDHLHVFDYVAYVHMKQRKLELKALKCIFLWYLNGVKGYKL